MIPSCNRPDFLAKCLSELAPGRQTMPAHDYEVVVSDDSVTKTVSTLIAESYSWARWTQGPRRGPAANRNHGAAQSTGDWVVFVDDDCIPAIGWLQAYADAARVDQAAEVLEGCTVATGSRESIDMEAPINTHGGFLWSCNFAIRRTLFSELGGFDPGFPGPAMEDVEFRTRLRKRGVGMVFVPGAVVQHPWRKKKGRDFVHVYARSVDYFLRKHPDEAGRFSFSVLLRILVAGTGRNTREAFRSCGGRGIGRLTALEFYNFLVMSWRALRRRPGKEPV